MTLTRLPGFLPMLGQFHPWEARSNDRTVAEILMLTSTKSRATDSRKGGTLGSRSWKKSILFIAPSQLLNWTGHKVT
jgi:hypothetical protein